MNSKLYYEAHITVEPVFGDRLEHFTKIARIFNFRVADLLMQKRKEDKPERSKFDTFCTSRSKSYAEIEANTLNMVDLLLSEGFKVYRYKIEDTILDSKIDDSVRPLEVAV